MGKALVVLVFVSFFSAAQAVEIDWGGLRVSETTKKVVTLRAKKACPECDFVLVRKTRAKTEGNLTITAVWVDLVDQSGKEIGDGKAATLLDNPSQNDVESLLREALDEAIGRMGK